MLKLIKNNIPIFIIILTLSVIANSYPLYRFYKDGVLFTGPNDGISQMLPFQMYIYEQYTSGNFFYSTDFGLGGDFYSDLSYYYSTSIVFMINILVILFMGIFFNLETDSINFWAENAIYMSIFKSMLIIGFTYLYFRVINIKKSVSLLGGFLFATSTIYYRFTVHWSFFSDVFIWLPILLLSIELFFRKKLFFPIILIVSISLINNFYFAYYQAITGIVYFCIRLFYKNKHDKKVFKNDYIKLIISVLLGAGISLFAFFYSSRSFLNNERPKYETNVSLLNTFDKHANIFYDNYLIVILFITIQAIFTFSLYKYRFYKLFSLLSIGLILISFTSIPDIVFNGFSAPQKRWHYLLAFCSTALIVHYLQYFNEISKKTYLYSLIPTAIILLLGWFIAGYFVIWLIMFPAIGTVGYLALCMVNKKDFKVAYLILIFNIALLSILIANVNMNRQIYHKDHEKRASLFYLNSNLFNSGLQQYNLEKIKPDISPGERIAWQVPNQDNSPMYQKFKGFSLYSSIFDQQWIDFYYRKMQINMPNESVSKYTMFQDRTNLYSLFSAKYFMAKEEIASHPSHFNKVNDDGKYQIYKNNLQLAPVKVTSNYYNDKQLKTPIDREHAMINGVITDYGNATINPSKNLLNDRKITYKNIVKKESKLIFMENNSIKIDIGQENDLLHDYYLNLYIDRVNNESNFDILINNYKNQRLFKSSKYRTHENNLTYNTKLDKNGYVTIKLTPGEYDFKLKSLYKEDYSYLKSEVRKEKNVKYSLKEEKNKIIVDISNNKENGMAVMNMPYEEGLTAELDGKKRKVERVNYVMSGVKVKKGEKNIVIKYMPPYFKTMCAISIFSIVTSLLIFTRIRKLPMSIIRIIKFKNSRE